MKMLSKFLSFILTLALAFSVSSGFAVYAQTGSGTADSPYLISTPAQLQAMNSNVSAYYKLTADINLNGIDFTPIGNADSGAFSGDFDGAGYTISGLSVFSGKYSGLFGCNEGVIHDVILDNIYVYGSRYIGGVVGYNAQTGTVRNCRVNSGEVRSDGGLKEIYAGGICGYNAGGAVEGTLYNGADVSAYNNAYAGGLIGYVSGALNLSNCKNKGSIGNNYVSGGLFGYVSGVLTLDNCENRGFITSPAGAIGGFVGIVGSIDFISCSNYGDITSYDGYNVGGFAGYVSGSVTFNDCFNKSLKTNGDSHVGGFVGIVERSSFFKQCGNTSDIHGVINVGGFVGYSPHDVNIDFIESYNLGNIFFYDSDWTDGSGFVGEVRYAHMSLSKCYNSGYLSEYGNGVGSGSNSERIITDCYNTGSSGKGFGITYNSHTNAVNVYDFGSVRVCSSSNVYIMRDVPYYYYNSIERIGTVSVSSLSDSEMRNQSSYAGFDFENVWTMGKCGLPILRGVGDTLQLSDAVLIMVSGQSKQLTAYKDDTETKDVSWTSSSSSCYVDSNGKVSASAPGKYTISVRDSEGNRANCSVYVISTTGLYFVKSSNTVGRGSSYRFAVAQIPGDSTGTVTWSSSDPTVASVDSTGLVTGNSIGSVIITAKTDNGYSASKTVTITVPAKSITLEKTNVTMYKGETFKINAEVSPADSTDSLSYYGYSGLSVLSDGTVTAKDTGNYEVRVSVGNVTIYCYIKVIDPPVIVTDVNMNTNSVKMKTGEVYTLSAEVLPSNATDKNITWSSTDDSVAEVNNGVIRAVGAGKTVIKAETSNGVYDYCEVTVTGVKSTNLSKIYVPELLDTKRDYIDVPVLIENNPGIGFANISVVYDSSVLEAQNVTSGTVFDTVLGSIDKENGTVKLTFTSDEDKTDDGVLALIRFKVLQKTQDGAEVRVRYMPGGITDSKAKAVSLNIFDGIMTASECKHENVEIKNASEPTCTLNGYTGDKYCPDCGTTVAGEIIEAKGHTEKTVPGKNSTCTSDGLTDGVICTVCNEVIKAQTAIPAGHKEVTVPGKSATCTETGLTDGTKCSVCGEFLTAQSEIPALGHTETVIPGKSAACTEKGLTDGVKCSVCGETLTAQSEIPALGHKFENGKCTVCSAPDPDYKPAENPTDKPTEKPTEKPDEPKPDEPTTKPDEPKPDEPTTKPDEPKHDEPTTKPDGKKELSLVEGCKQVLDNVKKTVSFVLDNIKGTSLDDFIAMFTDGIKIQNDKNGLVYNGMKFTHGDDEYTVIVKGDTEADGKITAADARKILRISARLESPDDITKAAADIDSNDKITAAEARAVLRFAARLSNSIESELPK